jgi:hypothetical protein
MATGSGVKTAFVLEFLARDRDANEAAVNRAWREAGNAGTISGSLVSKLRQKARTTPARANGHRPSASPARATSVSGGRDRLVDEVEVGIDRLIFQLKSEGDMPEVEAALRRARRILIRGHRGA